MRRKLLGRGVAADLESSRESVEGLTLVEIAVAIGFFAFIAMASAFTIMKSAEYRRQTFEIYRLTSAMRDLVAEMQEIANRPESLSRGEGISGVYGRYHGQTFPIPAVNAGQITVTCFAIEPAIPAQLGGPLDLNLDGDAADNLSGIGGGTDLKLVPLTVTARYDDSGVTVTRTLNRLLTKTSND